MSRNIRVIIAGVLTAVVLVVIGGIVAVKLGILDLSEASASEVTRSEVISLGSISQTISVTAPIEAEDRIPLSFVGSGNLLSLNIAEGEYVAKGDVLAELDSTDVLLDIQEAELTLELQLLALDRLTAGPSSADLNAARASVWQAQSRLAQVTQPADEYTLELAQNEVNQKVYERDIALRDYENALNVFKTGPAVEGASQRLDAAQRALDIALDQQAQLQDGASNADISSVYASLAQSQAVLERLVAGPREIDLEMIQLQIDLAQLALDSAKASLDDYKLVAPSNGLIVKVEAQVGDRITGGNPVITLLDVSSFHFHVLVDEIDIVRVSVGQAANITLDALPGVLLTGVVDFIAPVSIEQNNIVFYKVRVTLDDTDQPVKDGMTGSVTITTATLDNVLLVPNWAVRLDPETGVTYASLLKRDGSLEDVRVVLGLRGSQISEVISGLGEGDVVALRQERESVDFFGQD